MLDIFILPSTSKLMSYVEVIKLPKRKNRDFLLQGFLKYASLNLCSKPLNSTGPNSTNTKFHRFDLN